MARQAVSKKQNLNEIADDELGAKAPSVSSQRAIHTERSLATEIIEVDPKETKIYTITLFIGGFSEPKMIPIVCKLNIIQAKEINDVIKTCMENMLATNEPQAIMLNWIGAESDEERTTCQTNVVAIDHNLPDIQSIIED